MEKRAGDFGPIFWVHTTLLALFFASPFLLSWAVIIAVVVLYAAQLYLIGGCFLTQMQFGKDAVHKPSYWYYYLSKMGCPWSKHAVNIFANYGLTGAVLLLAFVWQIVCGKTPLLHGMFHRIIAAAIK